MGKGASDGGSGGVVVVSSRYLIVAVVLLSMIVGGGVVFLLVSEGSGSPKPKVIDSTFSGQNNPQPNMTRGGPPPMGARGNNNQQGPTLADTAAGARLSQLDKWVGAKSPQNTQQAVDDIKNWISQEPRYAAGVLGETHTSKNIVPRLVKDCKAYQQTIELVDAATAALNAKSASFSSISGGIGVGTYDTQAEYRNIKIEQGGKVLYASNFDIGADGWKPESGSWITVAGAYRNSASGTFYSYFGDESWSDYTQTLQARKISGKEGFLIAFGHKGSTKLNWNLGGYSNKYHFVEYDGQALDHSFVGPRIPGSIETGRWYDIRIDVKGSRVSCYLDGLLIEQLDITGESINESLLQGMRHWKAVALMELVREDEAAEMVKLISQSPWPVGSKAMTDIVTPLANRKNTKAVLKSTQGIIAGWPEDGEVVENALNQRINALRAAQRYDEALAEAKILFNYSSMEHTSDALKTLDRELTQVNGNDHAKVDLFHDEQVKGSVAPANSQPIISTIVKGVKTDALAYQMQIQSIVGDDYHSLIKKGALLLLSDKGDQAEAAFLQALDKASTTTDKQTVKTWIARAIKAKDGTIGRANQWVASVGDNG